MVFKRKLTIYQLHEDDCLFFFNLPHLSALPFTHLIENAVGIKSYWGSPADYDPKIHRPFIVGGLAHWKELVCSKLDRNPLILTFMQDPFEYVIEKYWCLACGIPSSPEIDMQSFNESPSMSIEEFMRDSQFREWIENPQFSSLLKMCDVWKVGMGDRLSINAQRRLVEERLDQMAYIGLVEYYPHSADLLFYTFSRDFISTSGLFRPILKIQDPRFRKEIMSPTVYQYIRKNIALDQSLYDYARGLFFDRHLHMARRMESELRRMKRSSLGIQVVPLEPAEQFLGSELALLRGIKKLRQFFLLPGSRREGWAMRLYHRFQRRETLKSVHDPKTYKLSKSEFGRWLQKNEPMHQSLGKPTAERCFSLVIFIQLGGEAELRRTIRSVLRMKWLAWEILVVLCDRDPLLQGEADKLAKEDDRIRVHSSKGVSTQENGGFRRILDQVQGDFLMIVGNGDVLAHDILNLANEAIDKNQDHRAIDIIYFDEDHLDKDGGRYAPWLKPNLHSPEMLLSANYLRHALFRRQLLSEQWTEEIPIPPGNADEWALAFHCMESARGEIIHLPRILYHVAEKAEGERTDGKSQKQVIRVVRDHLERCGRKKCKVSVSSSGAIQVHWAIRDKEKVSIIIPTKNQFRMIKDCVNTILEITDYPAYEVILVDSGSMDPRVFGYYSSITRADNVKLLRFEGEFNYSKVNNLGARNSTGTYLLFLNNDTKPLQEDWLRELVRWSQNQEIGIVGAKLLYPDDTIQFFGTVVGMRGIAGHVFAGMEEQSESIYGSTMWYRNFSAITGACMMMRREVYQEIGGFDTNYRIAFSDVAICIRALELGYRNVCTPFARIRHYEGKTRSNKVPVEDIRNGVNGLGNFIKVGDPYFNPNLSLNQVVPTLRPENEKDPITSICQVIYDREAGGN